MITEDKLEALKQVISLDYKLSDLPGSVIHHGTNAHFAQIILTDGPMNLHEGLAGSGLNVALNQENLAKSYAYQSRGRGVVLEGTLNPNPTKELRVAKIIVHPTITEVNVEKGLFPKNWNKDPMLSNFIHQNFDVIDFRNAQSAGLAIESNRFLVIKQSAGPSAVLWKSYYPVLQPLRVSKVHTSSNIPAGITQKMKAPFISLLMKEWTDGIERIKINSQDDFLSRMLGVQINKHDFQAIDVETSAFYKKLLDNRVIVVDSNAPKIKIITHENTKGFDVVRNPKPPRGTLGGFLKNNSAVNAVGKLIKELKPLVGPAANVIMIAVNCIQAQENNPERSVNAINARLLASMAIEAGLMIGTAALSGGAYGAAAYVVVRTFGCVKEAYRDLSTEKLLENPNYLDDLMLVYEFSPEVQKIFQDDCKKNGVLSKQLVESSVNLIRFPIQQLIKVNDKIDKIHDILLDRMEEMSFFDIFDDRRPSVSCGLSLSAFRSGKNQFDHKQNNASVEHPSVEANTPLIHRGMTSEEFQPIAQHISNWRPTPVGVPVTTSPNASNSTSNTPKPKDHRIIINPQLLRNINQKEKEKIASLSDEIKIVDFQLKAISMEGGLIGAGAAMALSTGATVTASMAAEGAVQVGVTVMLGKGFTVALLHGAAIALPVAVVVIGTVYVINWHDHKKQKEVIRDLRRELSRIGRDANWATNETHSLLRRLMTQFARKEITLDGFKENVKNQNALNKMVVVSTFKPLEKALHHKHYPAAYSLLNIQNNAKQSEKDADATVRNEELFASTCANVFARGDQPLPELLSELQSLTGAGKMLSPQDYYRAFALGALLCEVASMREYSEAMACIEGLKNIQNIVTYTTSPIVKPVLPEEKCFKHNKSKSLEEVNTIFDGIISRWDQFSRALYQHTTLEGLNRENLEFNTWLDEEILKLKGIELKRDQNCFGLNEQGFFAQLESRRDGLFQACVLALNTPNTSMFTSAKINLLTFSAANTAYIGTLGKLDKPSLLIEEKVLIFKTLAQIADCLEKCFEQGLLFGDEDIMHVDELQSAATVTNMQKMVIRRRMAELDKLRKAIQGILKLNMELQESDALYEKYIQFTGCFDSNNALIPSKMDEAYQLSKVLFKEIQAGDLKNTAHKVISRAYHDNTISIRNPMLRAAIFIASDAASKNNITLLKNVLSVVNRVTEVVPPILDISNVAVLPSALFYGDGAWWSQKVYDDAAEYVNNLMDVVLRPEFSFSWAGKAISKSIPFAQTGIAVAGSYELLSKQTIEDASNVVTLARHAETVVSVSQNYIATTGLASIANMHGSLVKLGLDAGFGLIEFFWSDLELPENATDYSYTDSFKQFLKDNLPAALFSPGNLPVDPTYYKAKDGLELVSYATINTYFPNIFTFGQMLYTSIVSLYRLNVSQYHLFALEAALKNVTYYLRSNATARIVEGVDAIKNLIRFFKSCGYADFYHVDNGPVNNAIKCVFEYDVKESLAQGRLLNVVSETDYETQGQTLIFKRSRIPLAESLNMALVRLEAKIREEQSFLAAPNTVKDEINHLTTVASRLSSLPTTQAERVRVAFSTIKTKYFDMLVYLIAKTANNTNTQKELLPLCMGLMNAYESAQGSENAFLATYQLDAEKARQLGYGYKVTRNPLSFVRMFHLINPELRTYQDWLNLANVISSVNKDNQDDDLENELSTRLLFCYQRAHALASLVVAGEAVEVTKNKRDVKLKIEKIMESTVQLNLNITYSEAWLELIRRAIELQRSQNARTRPGGSPRVIQQCVEGGIQFQFEEVPVHGDGWCTFYAAGVNNPETAVRDLRVALDNPQTLPIIREIIGNAIYDDLYEAKHSNRPFNIGDVTILRNIEELYRRCNHVHAGALSNNSNELNALMAYLKSADVQKAYLAYICLPNERFAHPNIVEAYLLLQNKKLATFHYVQNEQLRSLCSADVLRACVQSNTDPNVKFIVLRRGESMRLNHYNTLRVISIQPAEAVIAEVQRVIAEPLPIVEIPRDYEGEYLRDSHNPVAIFNYLSILPVRHHDALVNQLKAINTPIAVEHLNRYYQELKTKFETMLASHPDYAYGLCWLGCAYHNGWSVGIDYTRAASYYERSAQLHLVHANTNRGILEEHGQGRPVNKRAALGWYKKTRDQGGSAENHTRLLEAERQAAFLGNAQAQIDLGYSYFDGDAADPNDTEALRFLNLSIAQNNQHAKRKLVEMCHQRAREGNIEFQVKLGIMYYYGEHVDVNFVEVKRWLEGPARAGNHQAHYYLGYIHNGGYGIAANARQAYSHFERAYDNGRGIVGAQGGMWAQHLIIGVEDAASHFSCCFFSRPTCAAVEPAAPPRTHTLR